ncbi:hypothetical protein DENSPDRAFT_573353 [Dentipellis sp. KUC8613]|nr:hypothetical protein DENSPDRAFT_573353 [Dentipellis sp. KUC8613]
MILRNTDSTKHKSSFITHRRSRPPPLCLAPQRARSRRRTLHSRRACTRTSRPRHRRRPRRNRRHRRHSSSRRGRVRMRTKPRRRAEARHRRRRRLPHECRRCCARSSRPRAAGKRRRHRRGALQLRRSRHRCACARILRIRDCMSTGALHTDDRAARRCAPDSAGAGAGVPG